MAAGRPDPDKWLIATKLFPPNLPMRPIGRRELLGRVMESGLCPLTIVHAPAGYGKTTFLGQWYEEESAAGRLCAWLSLDVEENGTNRFLRYLAAALDRAGVPTDSLDHIVSQGLEGLDCSALVAVLIDTFGQVGGELLIFIDDFQVIDSGELLKLVAKMVLRLPRNIGIILSSRTVPNVRAEDGRAHGRVREISALDLRFTLQEMESLLNQQVDEDELFRLWTRTEGWPVACHMITLLRASGAIGAPELSALSGRTTDLAAYITEQVFVSLDADVRSFLMRTAVVNRFTGDLANELCGGVGSWQILEELQRGDLFIIPLDREGKWFRYHQMFREYLLEKLHRHDARAENRLHLKAARWFFDHDHLSEAVDHALSGGDSRLAAEMVDRLGGWRLIYQDRLDWIMDVFERLEPGVIDKFPRLFLAAVILLIKRGKLLEARERLEAMHGWTDGFRLWDGHWVDDRTFVELEIVRRIILEDYIDQPVSAESLAFAHGHLETIAPDDHILRALLHDYLASAYIDAGKLDKAASHIDGAAFMYRQAGLLYGAIYILYHRANLCVERAKLHDAMRELGRVREIESELRISSAHLGHSTRICMAEVALMQGRIDDAEDLLEGCLDVLESHDGWFGLYAKAYVTASRIAAARSGLQAALAVLDRARRVARERRLSRLMVLSDLEELRALLLAGRTAEAARLARGIALHRLVAGDPSNDCLSVFLTERAALALARLHLMQGQGQSVFELLLPLTKRLYSQGRFGPILEAWLLLARASYTSNDLQAAETFLGEAVRIAMFESFRRPFLDEGSALLPLYARVADKCQHHGRHFRAFLAGIDRTFQEAPPAVDVGSGTLGITQKEYLVVRELCGGLSNREIAVSLNVSEDTVKYRLKQVFRKWGLSSRQAAMRMALDKGITSGPWAEIDGAQRTRRELNPS